MTLNAEQIQAVRDGLPVTFTPPEIGAECVVLRADVYGKVKDLLYDGPLSREEQDQLLREAGQRAGWDDPEMDVYNDLVPRTP